MEKVYIFGHQSPDTDAVTASISLSYLKNKQGLNAEPRVLGHINKETKYALDKFNVEEKYKKIIKLAILNHNKGKIDDNLNEEEMLYAKIIRDADKLDIYYTICEYDFESIFWYQDFSCGPISEEIMNQFANDHFINYSCIKNNADQIPIFYAYIFDLYFDFSLEFLKEKHYLEKFTERICENFTDNVVKTQTKQILKISNEFLDSI